MRFPTAGRCPARPTSTWKGIYSGRNGPIARKQMAKMMKGLGTVAAVRFLEELGMARVAEYGRSLARYLQDELRKIPGESVLTPADPTLSASITTYRTASVPYDRLFQHLGGKLRNLLRLRPEFQEERHLPREPPQSEAAGILPLQAVTQRARDEELQEGAVDERVVALGVAVEEERGADLVALGLEVHAQVVTESKLFSGAATAFGAATLAGYRCRSSSTPTIPSAKSTAWTAGSS